MITTQIEGLEENCWYFDTYGQHTW